MGGLGAGLLLLLATGDEEPRQERGQDHQPQDDPPDRVDVGHAAHASGPDGPRPAQRRGRGPSRA
ncbi:hypothetical protein [Ornithinimicrobium kibberense]|uniref:hypothetical protein n=1 Tax=Ornithinimicrobium kibberense TaxID=282060 RepID=UPI003606AD56